MNIIIKLFTLMISLVALPTHLYAKPVAQENLLFDIKTESLLKGDIHYSFALSNTKELSKTDAKKVRSFDALKAFKGKKSSVFITKVAYVVKKPVGFFDHKQTVNPGYLSQVLGTKVKALDENTFKVSASESYKMHLFYESDDVTTLPHSEITQSVMNSKKLDIIAQGANSSLFKEMVDFNKSYNKGMSVTHHIPLTEKKTLVITYSIYSVKSNIVLENIGPNLAKEIQAIQERTYKYKIEN